MARLRQPRLTSIHARDYDAADHNYIALESSDQDEVRERASATASRRWWKPAPTRSPNGPVSSDPNGHAPQGIAGRLPLQRQSIGRSSRDTTRAQ